MPNYGDPTYWDARYKEQSGTTFDWLEDYPALKEIIYKFCPSKQAHILNLGCGNSELSELMYDDGYTNYYNIDISHVVIE